MQDDQWTKPDREDQDMQDDQWWMDQPAEAEKQKYAIGPQGSHLATLVAVIDLGTHEEEWEGVPRLERQVFLVWELANEIAEGTTNNILVGEKYNFSGNPKARYRKLLEAWRGRKYNEGEQMPLSKIVGQPCMLNIVHKKSAKGREYAIVEAVSALPKGVQKATPTRPLTARHCKAKTPVPDWIPFVLGENPAEVIARAEENRPGESAESPPAQTRPATQTDAERLKAPAPAPTMDYGAGMSKHDIPF
jgi:hypothetical protein